MNDETAPSKTTNNDDLSVESNETNRTNTIINNIFNNQYRKNTDIADSDVDTSSESTRGRFFDAIFVVSTLSA
jgi:hypothetical protein